MKVNILAFGIAKEIMNGSSIEIELNEGADSNTLKQILENNYPRLKELRSFMIAINDEYSSGEQKIKPGDEIAVIPPVSGG